MTQFAMIALNTAVNQTFHYHIPPELADVVQIGVMVKVGFRTAEQPGIVVGLSDESPVEQTKPILECYFDEPVLSAAQIELGYWLSATTLCTIGEALWAFLPPGIAGRRDLRVHLLDADAQSDDAESQRLLDLLKKRGTLTGEQLTRAWESSAWRKPLNRLRREKRIRTESILDAPRTKPKKVQVAALAIPPEHLPHVRARLGKRNRLSDALEAIMDECGDDGLLLSDAAILSLPGIGRGTLAHLLELGAVVKEEDGYRPADDSADYLYALKDGEHDAAILRVLARESSAVDVSWIYAQADATRSDLKRLEAEGLIALGEKDILRDPLEGMGFVPLSAPKLTAGQAAVWRVIRAALDGGTPSVALLHGVTGSGKTEIYLRAIARTIQRGRQALFLVPEIALTPQTIRRVLARFPQGVAVVHSRLSDGERFDTWRRARDGEIQVVVGTRSALFTPLPDIGLIILDEEHDASYKQDPPMTPPYYHARDLAEQIAARNQALVILGSATPDVETFYRASRGEISYLRLPERIMGHRVRLLEQAAGMKPRYITEPTSDDALSIDLPPVKVVDMRDELKAGNVSIFSRELHAALDSVLQQGQQAILFLNRRGMSTYVFCRDCGTVVTCPRCETPMTYHQHSETLLCHHCNTRIPPPDQCATCGSKRVKYFGAGTEQVEAAFREAFPSAVSLRWDSDAARQQGAHDLILSRFLHHEADVLIGTQMIAKGLDLPLVTLVGVVSADVGLNLPDFRAGERIFQVLAQVAGRAGRGMLGGRVVLQTYQPTHPAIIAASQHDYLGFYEAEIARRREMAYPPFRRLVRVLFHDANESHARDSARRAAERLQTLLEDAGMTDTELIGPVPCFYSRLNRIYRWQVILRGADPTRLFEDFSPPREWIIDVDPVDLL